MAELVQVFQAVSGGLWLAPAVYLTPRIVRSWRHDASRIEMLSAPIGFFAWLMVGFSLRWLVWSHSIPGMNPLELAAWTALYALSAVLAAWVMVGAWQTRRD